jgi:hypothetical protein
MACGRVRSVVRGAEWKAIRRVVALIIRNCGSGKGLGQFGWLTRDIMRGTG